MQVTTIRNQADMTRFIAGVSDDCRSFPWRPFIVGEFRLMEAEHAGYFEREAGPSGSPWPKLEESTIRKKGHARILIDKRKLIEALTKPQSEHGIRIDVDERPRAIMIFGEDTAYGFYHDEAIGQKLRQHVGVTVPYFEAMTGRATDYALQAIKA